jgi:putative nucleotidyltransferase with HDIG domain
MTEAARFLGSFGRALSAAALYSEGHPALERAIDSAWRDLSDLVTSSSHPAFTLLGETVLFGEVPLRDRRSWEWSERLSDAGLQRLEFDRTVDRDGFEGFLQDVLARIAPQAADSAGARQFARQGIRSGSVGLRSTKDTTDSSALNATLGFTMRDEVETLRWLLEEVKAKHDIPLVEAETIVRSLSVAMHADRRVVLPLLRLKEFDQYTTTHSLNVSVLAMGLAEHLGLSSGNVREYGVAGLLHDIGKVRVPLEILTKPGKLTDQEREVLNRHPCDGARLILRSEENLELAAVVAYEHHIMINGGGYPALRYGRACHHASQLVHVCDVYDALRTDRPYRAAWPEAKTLAYLRERAGLEFDPGLVEAFIAMMHASERQVAVLSGEDERIASH